ncbi:hypothetical protein [uncultured Sphingomonas sp.]|uniref:hypothetical protein n=1 Tax=uncultured Sphingomonas sp. TaxID=158754 RepID=UPI0025CF5B8F|nr:hypothetical protein [uncultured Sphingomonas sp.]
MTNAETARTLLDAAKKALAQAGLEVVGTAVSDTGQCVRVALRNPHFVAEEVAHGVQP